MTQSASPTWSRWRAGDRAGFSLVEVTLALGIMAFCMIAILGLLPVGVNTLQSAQDESRATAALNLVATSARSVQLTGRNSSGIATYKFPQFLSDNLDPASNPTTFSVGSAPWTYTYFVLEDGSLRKSNDTTPARQTLFVQVTPPLSDAEPLRIYAVTAWPWKGSDKPTMTITDLKGRQGFMDSYIVYAPRR